MKIAILTNMMEFQPGYSLTGIVKDQATMLTSYGHEVQLFVNSQYHGEEFDPSVTLIKKIPFSHLTDYRSKNDISPEHKKIVEETKVNLVEALADVPVVFTHDFLFTGWFMPYGLGCVEASKHLPDARWFHWIHSIPTAEFDWWQARDFGNLHKIIYPNETDRQRVAEQYRGERNDVRVIPHIKDLRSWFDFDEETCKLIRDYPGIMQADIVQIYPASVDRLKAKRLGEVITIISNMKKSGYSVFLVVANQWATGRQQKESVDKYKTLANRQGLRLGDEICFTSDWQDGKYDVGIPKRMLRELFQCSNLFIFPTNEESFGLVLPEASLAGGVLCVLNKSLGMQLEVSGFTTLFFDFGAYNHELHIENEGKYFKDIAQIILGRMQQNEVLATKTFMRKTYNWDHLYKKFYQPIMAECKTW